MELLVPSAAHACHPPLAITAGRAAENRNGHDLADTDRNRQIGVTASNFRAADRRKFYWDGVGSRHRDLKCPKRIRTNPRRKSRPKYELVRGHLSFMPDVDGFDFALIEP